LETTSDNVCVVKEKGPRVPGAFFVFTGMFAAAPTHGDGSTKIKCRMPGIPEAPCADSTPRNMCRRLPLARGLRAPQARKLNEFTLSIHSPTSADSDPATMTGQHPNQPDLPDTPHHAPRGFSDRFALAFTKLMRFFADTFFAKRYGHRAIVLETVAAVPGMVGGTITHLTCLRRMVDDDGWIRTLMEEAENERMHLMTFIQIAKPTMFERLVIMLAQWIFYVGFFLLYLISRRTAHRVVGYFEEEAVISYTLYLQ